MVPSFCSCESEGAKTFLIDIPVMILFGALFAVFETSAFNKLVLLSRYFWHGLVFTTIFNVAVFYAIATYPDWMWMYFLEDSGNTTGELIYIFVFLYYLPYVLGFYLGIECKKRAISLWASFIAVMAASEIWVIWHLFDRYSVVGTREQFMNGTATSLFSPQNPIGAVTNGSVVFMVLYFVFVLFRHRRARNSC